MKAADADRPRETFLQCGADGYLRERPIEDQKKQGRSNSRSHDSGTDPYPTPESAARGLVRSRHLLAGVFDLQVIGDREYVGYTLGGDVDQIAIGFGGNHSFECDVTVLHNNVDGWHGAKAIARG